MRCPPVLRVGNLQRHCMAQLKHFLSSNMFCSDIFLDLQSLWIQACSLESHHLFGSVSPTAPPGPTPWCFRAHSPMGAKAGRLAKGWLICPEYLLPFFLRPTHYWKQWILWGYLEPNNLQCYHPFRSMEVVRLQLFRQLVCNCLFGVPVISLELSGAIIANQMRDNPFHKNGSMDNPCSVRVFVCLWKVLQALTAETAEEGDVP